MELFGLLSPGLFVLLFVIALLSHFFPGPFDGDRVKQYISGMGATLLDKKWVLIAPGCLGDKNARVYQIVYRDHAGLIHRAQLKISGFGGISLSNDQIVRNPERWTSGTPEVERK